jgi:predicted metal-dependent HD superfamily phosphohydrolase
MKESEVNNTNESTVLKETLRPKWNDLCHRLNISNNQDLFNDIANHYSEPHRAYHTIVHVDNCLKELNQIKPLLSNPEAVELAIWLHDIIYTIGKNDNEEKSAEFARGFCQKNNLSSDFTKQVETHILATKHISPSSDLDSQYLADIDMAILGQTPDIFDKYEEKIYLEYSTVYSKADYQKGRIDFLQTVLKNPIYLTDYFKNKYQQLAEDNIKRIISDLQN